MQSNTMRTIIKVWLVLCCASFLYAQSPQEQIAEIEASIVKAQRDFELQKKERNITKLLAISKVLYENNQKLKALKGESSADKLKIALSSAVPLDTLAVQDRLEVRIVTQHLVSEEYTPATLRYEVFKEAQSLVSQEKTLYEKGGTHEERFSFEILEPSNAYKVCATLKEQEKSYNHCEGFAVKEPIKLEPLIITKSMDASHSDASILPGDTLYVFAYYTNKTSEPLDARVVVKETKSGKVLFEQQFNKEPTPERKRMGVEIDPSAYKEGDQLAIALHVKSESVRPIKQEGSVSIASFQWSVSMPQAITQGEHQSFSITPPKEFEAPVHFTADFNSQNIFVGKDDTSPTKGNLLSGRVGQHPITLFLHDAKGRKVSRQFVIAVNEKVVVAQKKEPEHLLFLPTQPLSTESSYDKTPTASVPPTEDQSWKTNIANDTKKIMQEYNQKMQEIDKKYATGTTNTKSSYTPKVSAKEADPWCKIALQDIAKYNQQYQQETQEFRRGYPNFVRQTIKKQLEFYKNKSVLQKIQQKAREADNAFTRYPSELQCIELTDAVNAALDLRFYGQGENDRYRGLCMGLKNHYEVMQRIQRQYKQTCK